ncbi:MAG: site-specific DNA-methyltransferase [Pseudomonadota bacterium]
MRELPDDSIHCCVTSPPYWGLRDYGVEGQLGLERSLAEHIDKMVEVFEEVRRVLRPDGTLWLNYGDCYASTPNGRSAADTKAAGGDDRTFRDKPFSTVGPIFNPYAEAGDRRGKSSNVGARGQAGHTGRVWAGGTLKPKDLCMVPNRVAIALQEAGWWVRSEIIWAKPNPMPESVTDRPAGSHEKIWLLSKSARYWYDAEAVRERRVQDEDANGFRGGSYVEGAAGPRKERGNYKKPAGWAVDGSHTAVADNKGPRKRGHAREHTGFRNAWDQMSREEQQSNGRNCRNVWTIATKPFSEAHFATFPPELAERCIKAGCPIGGTVLDPFGGAGTTGLVADRLQRGAILIELNPEYAGMARERIHADAPLFSEVEAVA